MDNMLKLAIIGAGRMARIFAEQARKMKVTTYCFAWEDGAIAKEYVDHFYPISIFEKDRILDICKREKIDGVVATTELTISIAAYISSELGLIGNSYNVSSCITNKFRNRECIKSIIDIKQPKYNLVHDEKDMRLLNVSYPVILKPVDKGGKKGVVVLNSPYDIKNAFAYIRNDVKNCSAFIVEEYIQGGMEYSVESISINKQHYFIQITEKISSGPPHCVELGHKQPADLDIRIVQKIHAALSEALTSIGIKYGPCHTEIKIIDGDIYLIEFNARPGGDHIAYPLTELSTGFNYIQAIIDVALGKEVYIDYSTFSQRYVGVIFITKQTMELKKIFDVCQNYEWCIAKSETQNKLTTLLHNDGYNTNYFIYSSDKPIDFYETSKH